MPKLADRDTRHTQILEALLRVAGSQGLHAVTMRSVAAEANISLRLVQYYFETKEKLLLAALDHLAGRQRERIQTRVRDTDAPDDPRTIIEAVLTESLPTDQDSRTFHLVYTAYAVHAATDPALAAQPFLRAPDTMEHFLADQLRHAQRDGTLPPHRDAHTEAAILLALSAGLGTAVLLGQRTAENATTAISYHLDHLGLTRRPA
ncbi:TetR/AcrR family transcriptional regulator [Acrocarpospora catenulata]|uniref:TetR/AcrR family transcriptional regulator n=1 Tax=Acrocarpospora catenulata TaxID=2836182 RepID=UPI001BD9AEE5|nr:TetR/AcrR family transcriptional regulator [Acrocarpospora catenulata]